MSERKPLTERSVYRYASKVDGGQLIAAFDTLKLKYGIAQTGIDLRGLPTHSISSEALENKTTGLLMCGAMNPNRSFTLFEPGLLARARLGFSVRLSVLETTAHEILHTADGERQYPGTYTDALSTEESGRIVAGFREVFYLDGHESEVHNNLFNEGVTQLLALELMREYLALGPYLNVTSRQWKRHFLHIRMLRLGTFYPHATSLVEAFVSRIARVIGDEKVIWDRLYQDYFLGTSLLNDSFWIALIREAGIEKIMRSVRTTQYRSLPTYEALLRRNRGAWDDVRFATDLRPIEG